MIESLPLSLTLFLRVLAFVSLLSRWGFQLLHLPTTLCTPSYRPFHYTTEQGVIFLCNLWVCIKITAWRKCLHQTTLGVHFLIKHLILQDAFFLWPVPTAWLFPAMASEHFSVLGWIWVIHPCRTSEFVLDFMKCLNLSLIWISSIAYLFHSPHIKGDKSGVCKSGVGEWNIETDIWIAEP